MAYGASGLTRLSSGGGGNLWLYRSLDASTAADAAGYFNDAVAFLNIGDVILYQQVVAQLLFLHQSPLLAFLL